jgi:hypothetical protein
MPDGAAEHIDLSTEPRSGWFTKVQDPIKSYRDNCAGAHPKCYHGPYWQAHHIVPGTSLKESGEEYAEGDPEKKKFLEEVQWVAKWNINEKPNLIGLPTFLSFEIFYRAQSGQGVPTQAMIALYPKYARLIKWRCTSFSRALSDFAPPATHSPAGRPVHNPVSFGHAKYDDEVQQRILDNVWKPLVEKGAKHELDPANAASNVAAAIKGEITHFLSTHLLRPEVTASQSPSTWTSKPAGWFKPYCMLDGFSDDPLAK